MHRLYISLLLLLSVLYWSKGACADKVPHNNIAIGGVRIKTIPYDPVPYGDFTTLTVPIKRAGNLIIIEAQIDSLEGNFVLDTGAPYLVLNETYFRDAPRIAEREAGGINGASSGAFTTAIKSFSILDLHYSRLSADVTDLSSIENGRHIKILGLLGTRLFSKLAITIDLFHNVLYIQKPDRDGNIQHTLPLLDHPQLKMPFKYLSDVIYLKGAINDKAMWFAFDTGAEVNLLDYSHSKKLISSMEVINRAKLTGVGGSRFEVINARFDKLMIGDQFFYRNRILITNLEKMGNFYDQSVEGILGYDFFVRGAFTINFVKKEFEIYIYNNQ